MTPEPHKMQNDLLESLTAENTGEQGFGKTLPPASDAAVRYPVKQSVSGQTSLLFLCMAALMLASSAVALAFETPWLVGVTGLGLAGTALSSALRSRQAGTNSIVGTAGSPAHESGSGEKVSNRIHEPAIQEDVLDRRWETGETTSQIAQMFDALGDMLVIMSPEGKILGTNATLMTAFGIADPTGKTLEEAGIILEETECGIEVYTGTGNDTRVWAWRQTAARQNGTDGLVIHAIGRDVTAEREAKSVLFEAKAKAEQASAAKTRFLATVSHEIRTPLNGILGMTHLLGQTEITPEQASYLTTVRESGHSLLQLIEDLLDATSIESGRFHLREIECNLRELVQASCELMAAQAHEKGIEIASHIAMNIPETIITDPGRLKQILFNLIGNAIKFTSKGGVLIEVECQKDTLAFHVNDTGPGLKPEDQKRIFEEFERADNSTTRRHGGAGLGLSISSRIVSALGGAVSVASTPGEGSCFTVTIPLKVSDAVELKPSATRSGPLQGKTTIILAPAGPVAETLMRSIEELGGVAAHVEYSDGLQDALALLNGKEVTDLLVDRRFAQKDPVGLHDIVQSLGVDVAKTILLAPENSRNLALAPELEAGKWLVRPVRTSSLVDVLTRRDDRMERNRAAGTLTTPSHLRSSDTPTYDILLAEDNPVNALLVRTILARQGHRVTLVENGRELVDLALDRPERKCRFDLVITDISMPELDGREAISQIRASEDVEQFDKLPILVLSADGQSETCDTLLAIGANGYAEKPVDPDWLASVVNVTAADGRKAREV